MGTEDEPPKSHGILDRRRGAVARLSDVQDLSSVGPHDPLGVATAAQPGVAADAAEPARLNAKSLGRSVDVGWEAEHQARVAGFPDLIRDAHRHSSGHRLEILASELCGCFYCEAIYAPNEITDWTDDGQTALCAKCGIDSVIGIKSGFPITAEFLGEMNRHWFGMPREDPEFQQSQKKGVLGWALVGLTAVVWLIAHFPDVDRGVPEFLKWPRVVLGLMSVAFLGGVLLPEAWRYRRSDLGGLFFVVCLVGICCFAVWALLTGFGD